MCGSTFRPQKKSAKFCSRQCMWTKNGGHNKKPESWWRDAKGYIVGRVWQSDGTRRNVRQHRYLMEQHLGRELLPHEDVHHRDGDKANNAIENLEVIEHAEHSRKHNAGRVYRSGHTLNLSDEERARRSERMKARHAARAELKNKEEGK